MNILKIIPNYSLYRRNSEVSNNTLRPQYSLNTNISYPNLSPIPKDTVSFCGKGKIVEEITNEVSKNKNFIWNPQNKKSMTEINKLCDSFKAPLKKFEWDLKFALKQLVCTESNPEGIIMPGTKGIHSRVKEPKKVARKGNKRNITTIDGLRKMGDVGGTRIVLRSGSQQETALVFSELEELIKKGYKILEVENYRSTPKDSYVSQKTLNKLEHCCNKRGQYPLITNRALPNNYTAIHVSFELPGGEVIELQIMSRDVENYKEVEDLFYKYRCNERFSDVYKPIQRLFNKIMPKLDDFQKETLERYHRDSYVHARRLPPRSAKVRFNPEKDFLPFPYSLPQELSPVKLYYQMLECKAGTMS